MMLEDESMLSDRVDGGAACIFARTKWDQTRKPIMVRMRKVCRFFTFLLTVLGIFVQAVHAEDYYGYQRFRDLKMFEDIFPDGSKPLAAHELKNAPRVRRPGYVHGYLPDGGVV